MNRKLSKEDKLGVGALASLPILQAKCLCVLVFTTGLPCGRYSQEYL